MFVNELQIIKLININRNRMISTNSIIKYIVLLNFEQSAFFLLPINFTCLLCRKVSKSTL